MAQAVEEAPWTKEEEAEKAKVRQLRLPSFEGLDVESIEVAFSGAIKLNPALDEDKKILDAIKFGRDVEVLVTAGANGVHFNIRRDTDGNPQVSGKRGLTVHSFDRASVRTV